MALLAPPGAGLSPEPLPCCLQEAQPHSGLLQASLITLYTIFITWCALANVPSKCSHCPGGCVGSGMALTPLTSPSPGV